MDYETDETHEIDETETHEIQEIAMPIRLEILKWINIIFGCVYLVGVLLMLKGNGYETGMPTWILMLLGFAFFAAISFVLASLINKAKKAAIVIGCIWYGVGLLQAALSLNIIGGIVSGTCLTIILSSDSKEYFAGTYRVVLPEDMNEEELINFYGNRKTFRARGILVAMSVILAITSVAVNSELLFPPYSAPFTHIEVFDAAEFNAMMEEIEALSNQNENDGALVLEEKTGMIDNLRFIDKNGTVIITGEDLISCKKRWEPQNGQVSIQFNLTEEGTAAFEKATERIAEYDSPNQYISIMLGDEVIAEPVILEIITGGVFNITLGQGDQELAFDELFKE